MLASCPRVNSHLSTVYKRLIDRQNKMSFKQFHKQYEPTPSLVDRAFTEQTKDTDAAPSLAGGHTTPRAVGPDELAVWDKVLALPGKGAELAAKGSPTSVTSQVVSGMNYTFTFEDGSTVTVYYQSWTNTLRVKVM